MRREDSEDAPSRPDAGESADPEAWLDAHGDALFAYAFRRLHDRDAAEDLVQETLLAALKAEANYRASARRRTWLIGILRHKLVDHLRQHRETALSQMAEAGEDESDPDPWFDRRGRWKRDQRPGRWAPRPGALLETSEFWDVFHECLRALPARQAEAFTLRELEQEPSVEACKVLGVKPTNLSVLLHRARAGLRRCLEQRWFVPERKGSEAC